MNIDDVYIFVQDIYTKKEKKKELINFILWCDQNYVN